MGNEISILLWAEVAACITLPKLRWAELVVGYEITILITAGLVDGGALVSKMLRKKMEVGSCTAWNVATNIKCASGSITNYLCTLDGCKANESELFVEEQNWESAFSPSHYNITVRITFLSWKRFQDSGWVFSCLQFISMPARHWWFWWHLVLVYLLCGLGSRWDIIFYRCWCCCSNVRCYVIEK